MSLVRHTEEISKFQFINHFHKIPKLGKKKTGPNSGRKVDILSFYTINALFKRILLSYNGKLIVTIFMKLTYDKRVRTICILCKIVRRYYF